MSSPFSKTVAVAAGALRRRQADTWAWRRPRRMRGRSLEPREGRVVRRREIHRTIVIEVRHEHARHAVGLGEEHMIDEAPTGAVEIFVPCDCVVPGHRRGQ